MRRIAYPTLRLLEFGCRHAVRRVRQKIGYYTEKKFSDQNHLSIGCLSKADDFIFQIMLSQKKSWTRTTLDGCPSSLGHFFQCLSTSVVLIGSIPTFKKQKLVLDM